MTKTHTQKKQATEYPVPPDQVQAANPIINAIKDDDEDDDLDPDDIEGPENFSMIIAQETRKARMIMFDAYQHFLFYIDQTDIEEKKPWGEHLTAHFLMKLNGIRNRKNGEGCNSPDVVAYWLQEMTLDNQEVLIDYILENHAGKQNLDFFHTKWGRDV